MSVTDSPTPGNDAYLGMLESLSRTPEQKKRARNLGIGYFVAAGIALAIFVRGDGGTSTFTLGGDSSIGLPGIPLAWICAVVLAALGGVQISRGTAKLQNALLAAATILFIVTLMAWAAAGRQFSLTGTLHDALKAATPLVLGALAGILCERSGIINIAIEGLLLAGAFTSALVGSATNIWIGILAAMAVSAVLALVLAWLAIRFHVDQVIVGFAINFFVLGLTSFLDSRVLTRNPQLNGTGTIAEWEIPGLSSIPIIGPILFEQTFYVYAALALVAITTWMLFKTKWGLRTRAVGEHPKAAGTLGVNVLRRRYINVTIAGAVAGFGGSWWTADVGRFNENITNGRGFIALAVVLVGRHHPVGALMAALVFGFADALALKFAFLNTGIPSEFLEMAPFLVTLLVVASVGRGAHVPAALGQPYEEQ
ncbi:MAG: ABC transporter permease [Ilumatobacter sp.]|jgi:general nucleoside transport system permease protein|uniref:ABC transporter permease n=1 Tax=Ilumatobacter sp. TaxID=1967498 RepID=UPI001D45DC9F|nr:ABC transporter permease [Ilumatobacter sp.]MBT5276397.1 ABC transporter permease [Ilumatobacter sp.]MBT5553852.1 ABC transporter permease [Ilumatobacter sp.]MBT5865274.1 ABC transporter permease [Ilumatobacter sp.]MDG0975782.1 ABC transporter permease [Ilumatobacter sp.]